MGSIKDEMPFLEHLEELRWRLIKSVIAVVAASFILYFFSEYVLAVLISPFNAAIENNNALQKQSLIFLTPTGGFMIRIKLSVFAAFVLVLPYVFHQFWQFIMPGLLEKERKHVPLVVFFSSFCFLCGAFFCYFVVLRFGLTFLMSFQTADLVATISVDEYLQFITMLIVVFGLVFELPVLSFFLTKIGLVTPPFLRHYRKHGIVCMVAISALITPPDIFTQLLLAGPLVLLYEISIVVSGIALKRVVD